MQQRITKVKYLPMHVPLITDFIFKSNTLIYQLVSYKAVTHHLRQYASIKKQHTFDISD